MDVPTSLAMDRVEPSVPAVIDEVVESPRLKTNKEYKAIQFMGQLLKQRLALGIPDSEWQVPEEEEAA